MKKINMLVLVGLFILCINMVVSAADVKIGGKVDALVIESVKDIQSPRLFNALLTVNAKVSDVVTAQLSTNFAGDGATSKLSGLEIGVQAENFVSVKIGDGALKAGKALLPALKERNTLLNLLCTMVNQNNYRLAWDQVGYSGDAGVITYALVVFPGAADDKANPTNDIAFKIAAPKLVEGLGLDLVYYLDTVTKVAVGTAQKSTLGIGAGYTISGVSFDAQYTNFEKATDVIDGAKEVSSNILVGVGYKMDGINLGLSYDMLGKASNIAVKAGAEISKGATLGLRADLPNQDLKDVLAAENTIGVMLGTEF